MENQNPYGEQATVARVMASERVFLAKVYGWMTLALTITGVVSMFTYTNESLFDLVVGNRAVFIGLILGELALVWILSASLARMSFPVAAGMFAFYSAINGLTLSFVFMEYTATSVASTFFITAGVFGAMSLYGYFTKRDLSSWGNLLLMALVGLIVVTLVNLLLASTLIYWITTAAGVLIFVGLTAYDTQKIKNLGITDQQAFSEEGKKIAVLCALELYLDFINLFLYLLRLFGRRS